MIDSLRIASLGVIDEVDLQFAPGLTVLTGETGAGKTMVLTSLSLLLGGRADAGIVRSGAQQAEVDGIFTGNDIATTFIKDLGVCVDDSEDLVISRTISAKGRSKARIHARPVANTVLADLGASLVTIHGQSEQNRLRSSSAQRQILDRMGADEHQDLLKKYVEAWSEAVEARRRRDEIGNSANELRHEYDELVSAIEEITAFDTHPDEDIELLSEMKRLTNIEELRVTVTQALAFLEGDDEANNTIDRLRRLQSTLSDGSRFDSRIEDFVRLGRGLVIEADALADEIRGYVDHLNADPDRLAYIHSRRARLNELLHGRATDSQQLLEWQTNAAKRVEELKSGYSDPAVYDMKLEEAQNNVRKVGEKLSLSRTKIASLLSKKVDAELSGLSMPGAHFSVELNGRKPNAHGLEDVVFMFSPHPESAARPLSKGASGGELSRIMLAVEVVLSTLEDSRTFVFDEIDAGIGGRTATEVGARLGRLGQTHQVIVVTHLAQVAAYAQNHLVVTKNGVTTDVRAVTGEERIDELVRMTGGEATSQTARRYAKELLSSGFVSQSPV